MRRLTIFSIILAIVSAFVVAKTIKVPAPKGNHKETLHQKNDFKCIDDSLLRLYRTDSIIFSGYDKTVESNVESFFITNKTAETLRSVLIELTYVSTDGRELHRRNCRIDCDIPSQQTRHIDIKSWDKQHSFRYHASRMPQRRVAIPYDISLNLLELSFLK